MQHPTFRTLLRMICFLKSDLILKFSIKFTGTMSIFYNGWFFFQNWLNFYRMLYMGIRPSIIIAFSIYFYILCMLYMCKFNLKLWNTVNSFLIGKIKSRLPGYELIPLSSSRAKMLWELQLHRVSHTESVSPIWSFFQ